jgi:hypothetical protein
MAGTGAGGAGTGAVPAGTARLPGPRLRQPLPVPVSGTAAARYRARCPLRYRLADRFGPAGTGPVGDRVIWLPAAQQLHGG